MAAISHSVASWKAKQAFTSSQRWVALSVECGRLTGRKTSFTRSFGFLGGFLGHLMESTLRIPTTQTWTNRLPPYFCCLLIRPIFEGSLFRELRSVITTRPFHQMGKH